MDARALVVAIAAAIAACGAPAGRPAAGPSAASAEPPVPAAPATLAVRGVALGLWDFAEPARRDAAAPWAEDFAEIRALGATHVMLVVRWRQRDVRSDALAPHPHATIPDAQLLAAIAAAHAAGLAVLVFPIVELEVLAPGAWRGTLAPRDLEAWWATYRAFVLRYAALAAGAGAAAFSVGSELGSLEGHRERWWALVGEVRRVFAGTVVYSANWDHVAHVSFADRLDALGVSAYPPLATGDDASVAELAAAWRKARAEFVGVAARAGRPLWITELGLPSRDGAARAPWDYTRPGRVDLEEQRRWFAAFAAAWADEPALAGVFVWEWSGAGGPGDGGYTPRGKPAARVLADFFAGAPLR